MKNLKPIIGISPQLDITNPFRHVRLFPQYQRSLEKAGAIGLMLPLTEDEETLKQICDLCDGFLFTGGQDLEPKLYGETEDENLDFSTGYAPERDRFESLFYPMVEKTGKPILAICRGFQIINVLHGGSIVQDLSLEEDRPVAHSSFGSDDSNNFHTLNVLENTQLHDIFKRDLVTVNSYHHQGIKTLGEGLTVSGVSDDGLIEAFDIDGLDFGVAVQWHPEVLFDSQIDDGKLFKAFVKACKDHSEKRRSVM